MDELTELQQTMTNFLKFHEQLHYKYVHGTREYLRAMPLNYFGPLALSLLAHPDTNSELLRSIIRVMDQRTDELVTYAKSIGVDISSSSLTEQSTSDELTAKEKAGLAELEKMFGGSGV